VSALPSASLAESLRVVGTGLVPNLARGLFSPRPRAMKVLSRLDTDRKAIDTLRSLRSKHGGEGVRLLGGRIVVLWGPDAIREVLDRSASDFDSGAGAKGKGMAHFQPDALTLSCGEEWRDRRAFNEAVLATEAPRHPDAERFVAVATEEVEGMRLGGRELDWSRWERLFDRLTLRVIFGDSAVGDRDLTELLERLMGEANRLVGVGGDEDSQHELFGHIERLLARAEPGSLAAHVADAPQTERTRVSHQVPHWIFAMRDTLGANAFRALAAIASDPAVCSRALEEASGEDPTSMAYLRGCLHEAMRLWPTVPLIAREATRETEILGEKLDEGTQVMILNVFNHRDPDALDDADRLRPERWQNGASGDYRFNHLSHGTQVCPGIPLVELLGVTVLAGVLREWKLSLVSPELRAGEPLPTMLDFYSIRLAAEPREE
jgi:cytochrome P450